MTMRTFASKYFPESVNSQILEETTLHAKNACPRVLLKQIDYVEAKSKSVVKAIMGLKDSTPELVKALHDLHIEGKYEKDGVPFTPPTPKNYFESARAYVHNLPYRVVDSPRSSTHSSRRASLVGETGNEGTEKKSVRWRENLVDVREFSLND